MDRDGVELLPEQSIKDELPGMRHVWLDGGYKGELSASHVHTGCPELINAGVAVGP
jgi:hypothetical protein